MFNNWFKSYRKNNKDHTQPFLAEQKNKEDASELEYEKRLQQLPELILLMAGTCEKMSSSANDVCLQLLLQEYHNVGGDLSSLDIPCEYAKANALKKEVLIELELTNNITRNLRQ